jgi:hypothetical protein
VRVVEDPAVGAADIDRALGTLARLMVRGYQLAGDHEAIIRVSPTSLTLTDSPNPRPDHDTNNEAA